MADIQYGNKSVMSVWLIITDKKKTIKTMVFWHNIQLEIII